MGLCKGAVKSAFARASLIPHTPAMHANSRAISGHNPPPQPAVVMRSAS